MANEFDILNLEWTMGITMIANIASKGKFKALF